MKSKDAKPRFGVLRLIAVYKITKVLLLLAAGYFEFRLRDASMIAKLYSWASTLPYGIKQEWVLGALAWFSGLSPRRLQALGIVTLAYAVVFSVEGVGLWLQRRWAEWLTIFITGSLIPLEAWELAHRPSVGKIAVLAVNVAIVWYLIILVRSSEPAGGRGAG